MHVRTRQKDSSARLPAAVALGTLLGAAWLACAGAPEPDPASLANAYLAQGREVEAVREIELAVRSRPNDPRLRRRAAEIHAERGDLARAVGHLEVALQAVPDDVETSIALGALERRRQRDQDAYTAFKRAAQLAPEDSRAVAGWALAAEALGLEAEAEAAYAQWRALGDTLPAAPAP
ncbi:MAG: hypothetical protein AAF430_02835 [Myxococcota bacterium]